MNKYPVPVKHPGKVLHYQAKGNVMIVQVIVMVALVQVFSLVPAFAGDRPFAGKTRVAGPGTQLVSPLKFQRALLSSFQHQFSIPDIVLSVDVLFPKTPIKVPKGVVEIRVPPDSMNGRMGRRSYRMGLSVNQKFERMVNVVAEVEARMPVVVPVRFIKAHETIEATDVMVQDFSLPSLTQDFLKNPEAVLGKNATRLLTPNRPILESFVAERPVIFKGDRVIIEARRGTLLVQTMGVAKETGAPGKMIAVQNQKSKREVMGRVLSAGLVEVIF